MMSFHHNGAYIIDELRNDDSHSSTAFNSNPFPCYNYGRGGRETFEFECNMDEDDDDDMETIQINIDNFNEEAKVEQQS